MEHDTAGASARAEQARRARRARERAVARYGRLAPLARALQGEDADVARWRKGADGEEHVARRLAHHLRDTGVVLLHDRRMPRSRANIDHLAVGPGGVTIVDAKNYSGKVRVEHGVLRVAGRDRTKLVDGVQGQVAAVRTALHGAGVPEVTVVGAICLVDHTQLPLLGRLRVRDVRVDAPRPIAKLCRRDGALTSEMVAAIAEVLRLAFPPAAAHAA